MPLFLKRCYEIETKIVLSNHFFINYFVKFFIYIISLFNIVNAQIALPTFHGAQKPHTLSSSSSGPYVFTNCGATGKSGPTLIQVNATYTSGNTLNGSVTINTQGIQEWTVPSSGTYRILASGAAGGTNGFGRGGYGCLLYTSPRPRDQRG